ncbi:MAG: hypothetical protein WAW61_09835 [Methylococcaceae bacterium]
MRNFVQFFIKSIPLIIGLILTLFALSFLVQFVEGGADLSNFGNEDIWGFIFFAVAGVPTLLFGVNKLAE